MHTHFRVEKICRYELRSSSRREGQNSYVVNENKRINFCEITTNVFGNDGRQISSLELNRTDRNLGNFTICIGTACFNNAQIRLDFCLRYQNDYLGTYRETLLAISPLYDLPPPSPREVDVCGNLRRKCTLQSHVMKLVDKAVSMQAFSLPLSLLIQAFCRSIHYSRMLMRCVTDHGTDFQMVGCSERSLIIVIQVCSHFIMPCPLSLNFALAIISSFPTPAD